MFPKQYTDRFRDLGIDVNDPHFGAWWEAKAHQAAHGSGYNEGWERFLMEGPSRREAMDRMRKLAEEYKLTLTSGGR